MAINPSQITVGEVFGNKKYMVDFYQREYKWNDEVQSYKPIKSLLDDIFYRFELSYQKQSEIDDKTISEYDWYYLNSFMTNTVNGNIFIVDGQQRLTTLTVLIIHLYHLSQKLNLSEGVISNIRKRICDFDDIGNMVFWVGFEDRKKALENIYQYGVEGYAKHVGNCSVAEKNIYEAYKTISNYFDSKNLDIHMFNAFRLYLFQRVILIQIDVNDSKDVAMAFEVINDRGIPLKAYEILKGKILGLIDKNEVGNYIKFWEDNINSIASEFNEGDIDEFLSYYFKSKFADTALQYRELDASRYHKTIYLDEFNKKIGFKHDNSNQKEYIANAKTFVKETLPFYCKLFKRISNDCYYAKSKNDHVLFNAINEQYSQFYLLMAAIDINDKLYEEKYALVPKLFDRFYTILNLTDSYKSNTFNNIIIELGAAIRGKSPQEITSIFESKLLDVVKKEHNRDGLQEAFRYEFFAQRGYNNLGSRFLRYFYARIDRFIADNSNLNTAKYYEMIKQAQGKNKHHIEHILANNDENLKLFADEDEFNQHRNRLGGLVLLKDIDNMSSSNEVYADKIKTYSGSATLFAQTLNKDFMHCNKGFDAFCKKYNLDFKTYDTFDKTAIEERQKLLFEMSGHIWGI
jgi:uncharacterized protein with ParB-like and HNH nuclease domain